MQFTRNARRTHLCFSHIDAVKGKVWQFNIFIFAHEESIVIEGSHIGGDGRIPLEPEAA
jgi:hypothetical protein